MGANVSSPDQKFRALNIQSAEPWKPRFDHPGVPFRHHQAVSPLVTEILNKNQWGERFNSLKNTNKLLVIDFAAKWCGPCKSLDPVLREFASKYTDVEFVKIDVDALTSLSMEFNLHTLPAIVLMKRGEEMDRVVGFKVEELQKKIEIYRQPFY